MLQTARKDDLQIFKVISAQKEDFHSSHFSCSESEVA